ncbi:MAG: hypothetical protein ACLGHL_10595 [Actinomycetota bacterium]
MSFRKLGAGVFEAWVRLYTFGLDGSEAADRRAELASDVWEQRRVGWSDSEIFKRFARGIGADLVWRWERGFLPVWLRLPVRMAGVAVALLMMASIQHATGTHTFIGNAIYVGWFVVAALALLFLVRSLLGRLQR